MPNYKATVRGERRPLAPRYHLIDDYLAPQLRGQNRPRDPDLSLTPYGVIAVVPLALPVSASRNRLFSSTRGESCSVTDDPAAGVRVRGPVIVIEDDFVQGQVRTSKSSPNATLSASLLRSKINYLSAVLPGDYVFCWMLQSRDRARELVRRIRSYRPCNEFRDGLKFYGRVQDVTRDRQVTPDGTRSVSYELTASAFTELQASTFCDPHLAESYKTMNSWMAKVTGRLVSELLDRPVGEGEHGRRAVDVNHVIPLLFDVLLGEGISPRAANPGGRPETRTYTGLTRTSDAAPYAYVVPRQVGQLLGKQPRSNTEVMAAADVIELLTGVQKYAAKAGAQMSAEAPWTTFTPDGVEPPPAGEYEVPQHKATGRPMLGQFVPQVPDLNNKPVWAVLHQFLNPVVNEMYCVLRPNEAGRVVPQVVVRQIPFSTRKAATNFVESGISKSLDGLTSYDRQALAVTQFLELPRWVLHPALVLTDRLSRSDSLRFNFVHVSGHAPLGQTNNSYTYQLVRNPPVRDDLDIQRSGLRPYVTNVACSLEDAKVGPRAWMEVASDWLLGQQMTLTGHVVSEGLDAPIAPGDNVEFDGCVLHVEEVVHSYSVGVDGRTSFTTSLALSHGVRSETNPEYRRGRDDSHVYYATRQDDDLENMPGVTADHPGQTVEDPPLVDTNLSGPGDRLV